MTHAEARQMLKSASKYLRDNSGRTATEGPRRILTAAMKCVGTAQTVDLNARNLRARLLTFPHDLNELEEFVKRT